MTKTARQAVAPLIFGAAVVIFAAITGCEKASTPPVPADRLKDPVYLESLKKAHSNQVEIARRGEPLQANMTRMRERARAVLGKDATDAEVDAELDANPGKYPGWRELKARMAENEREMAREHARMRATVRARILKEAAAKKTARNTK